MAKAKKQRNLRLGSFELILRQPLAQIRFAHALDGSKTATAGTTGGKSVPRLAELHLLKCIFQSGQTPGSGHGGKLLVTWCQLLRWSSIESGRPLKSIEKQWKTTSWQRKHNFARPQLTLLQLLSKLLMICQVVLLDQATNWMSANRLNPATSWQYHKKKKQWTLAEIQILFRTHFLSITLKICCSLLFIVWLLQPWYISQYSMGQRYHNHLHPAMAPVQ